MNKPKIIAFYLPQYHPTPENDKWWGKGFTEWTNVGRAKSLFKGHYQPRVPADLGYYDLRLPEVREQQVELAKEAGIYGFCYWHYWFGNGKRLLGSIWDNVIESGKPDFPICLGWANHSWYAKTWDNKTNDKLLMEQTYPGIEDYTAHFYFALKAFKDQRYIKHNGKPVFYIFDSNAVPKEFIDSWNKLAKENGFKDGICFIGKITNNKDFDMIISKGFSYLAFERMDDVCRKKGYFKRRLHQLKNILCNRFRNCYTYKEAYPYFIDKKYDIRKESIPIIIPCWDHSPRSTGKGLILHNSTPKLFGKHVRDVFKLLKEKDDYNFIFLKSWNEWGEGNYMEPDTKWGKQYITTLRKELDQF